MFVPGGNVNADATIVATIADPATSPRTAIQSQRQISNAAFREFVTTAESLLTDQGIDVRFSGEPLQSEELGSIHFFRLPIANSGAVPISVPTFTSHSDTGRCEVRSPWVEVSSKDNGLGRIEIRAKFYWNERQILYDQAILSGMMPALLTPTASLGRHTYKEWADTYARNVIQGGSGTSDAELLANGLPLDLLWLFRHSPQSTRGPFSDIAIGYGTAALERVPGFYANLAVRVATLCFQKSKLRRDIGDIREALTIARLSPPSIER